MSGQVGLHGHWCLCPIFSDELFFMEKVLSDLRKKVIIDLRANKIDIPYPIKEVRMGGK